VSLNLAHPVYPKAISPVRENKIIIWGKPEGRLMQPLGYSRVKLQADDENMIAAFL